jgi:hypothetical protein
MYCVLKFTNIIGALELSTIVVFVLKEVHDVHLRVGREFLFWVQIKVEILALNLNWLFADDYPNLIVSAVIRPHLQVVIKFFLPTCSMRLTILFTI